LELAALGSINRPVPLLIPLRSTLETLLRPPIPPLADMSPVIVTDPVTLKLPVILADPVNGKLDAFNAKEAVVAREAEVAKEELTACEEDIANDAVVVSTFVVALKVRVVESTLTSLVPVVPSVNAIKYGPVPLVVSVTEITELVPAVVENEELSACVAYDPVPVRVPIKDPLNEPVAIIVSVPTPLNASIDLVT